MATNAKHEAGANISEAGRWTREQTLSYFRGKHGLDLSEQNNKQLAVFVRCEKRGGNVQGLFESSLRLAEAMADISPEEEALWDKQLQAEGIT